MRKFIMLVSIISLLLLTVGCENNKENNNIVSDNSSIEQIEESNGSNLSEDKIPTDISGLYQLDNGISYYSVTAGTLVNGDIIWHRYLVHTEYSTTECFVPYSLSTGEVLGQINISEEECEFGKLDDGNVYMISLASSKVFFYDKNCLLTNKEDLSEKITIQNYASISPDGKYMLYNTQDGKLNLYTFETGESSEIGDTGFVTSVGYKDGCFYIQSFENKILKVSPENKTLEEVYNNNETISFASPQYVINEQNSYFVITDLDDISKQKMTEVTSDQEIILAAKDHKFVTSETIDKKSIVRIYDIDNSISANFEIEGQVLNINFCNNDYLIIISEDKDNESLLYYLYDLSETSTNEPISVIDADESLLNEITIPEWEGDEKTIVLAQEILDKYGVRVLFGADDFAGKLLNYSYEPTEQDKVYSSLEFIDNLLDYFPKNMISEIGGNKEIWIYLCNNITDNNNEKMVEGLATSFGGYKLILLDNEISEELVMEVLVHEFSHLIDDSIDWKWLEGWIDLLPDDIDDIAYYNEYVKTYENDFTPFDNGDTEVWFYDHYSRTFPTEDRAVIFQKLYRSYIDGDLTQMFKENENLRKKARYYCVMLRQNLESCNVEDTLPWEEHLDLDLNEFNVE